VVDAVNIVFMKRSDIKPGMVFLLHEGDSYILTVAFIAGMYEAIGHQRNDRAGSLQACAVEINQIVDIVGYNSVDLDFLVKMVNAGRYIVIGP
jgi:hypothetical protein